MNTETNLSMSWESVVALTPKQRQELREHQANVLDIPIKELLSKGKWGVFAGSNPEPILSGNKNQPMPDSDAIDALGAENNAITASYSSSRYDTSHILALEGQ